SRDVAAPVAARPVARAALERLAVSALLEVEGLRLSRAGRAVLDGISLLVAPREICALMGLSGSGKTTVLRAAVALEGFQAGRIGVGGFSLGPGPVPPESHLRELRRSVGMVFQSHALFEHLTALENTALAPVYAHGRPAAASSSPPTTRSSRAHSRTASSCSRQAGWPKRASPAAFSATPSIPPRASSCEAPPRADPRPASRPQPITRSNFSRLITR